MKPYEDYSSTFHLCSIQKIIHKENKRSYNKGGRKGRISILHNRGKIKWQVFFMPEHIKMLKEADLYSTKQQPRTQLDESHLDELPKLILMKK